MDAKISASSDFWYHPRGRLGTKTLYIQPGSPWENGDCESFNGKLRNELLNGELFYTLREAQVLIEQWQCHYNRVRPHSALGYRSPAPDAWGLASSPRIISIQPAKRLPKITLTLDQLKRAGQSDRIAGKSAVKSSRVRLNCFVY